MSMEPTGCYCLELLVGAVDSNHGHVELNFLDHDAVDAFAVSFDFAALLVFSIARLSVAVVAALIEVDVAATAEMSMET